MYRHFGKRIFDLMAAGMILIVLFPLLACLACLVRVYLGSPLFFVQQRPGKDGRLFKIVKFRSMIDKRDEDGNLLPDAKRLTGFGRFLRSSSLDELPELLNVLRGEMSFVGPRPLRTYYLARDSPAPSRRHVVRPAITGC